MVGIAVPPGSTEHTRYSVPRIQLLPTYGVRSIHRDVLHVREGSRDMSY
jgi:hypothetical protein